MTDIQQEIREALEAFDASVEELGIDFVQFDGLRMAHAILTRAGEEIERLRARAASEGPLMSDAPKIKVPFAVPLDEQEASALAHYEDAASALGVWQNTIPRAIREHFARLRAGEELERLRARVEELGG